MLTAKANHDHITIDFFYHGSTVSVRGESDPGVDLIIKMTAPEGHQTLKQKGKVGGLLWMNVGTLKFEHVPNFYAVYSTKKPEDILGREELERDRRRRRRRPLRPPHPRWRARAAGAVGTVRPFPCCARARMVPRR